MQLATRLLSLVLTTTCLARLAAGQAIGTVTTLQGNYNSPTGIATNAGGTLVLVVRDLVRLGVASGGYEWAGPSGSLSEVGSPSALYPPNAFAGRYAEQRDQAN